MIFVIIMRLYQKNIEKIYTINKGECNSRYNIYIKLEYETEFSTPVLGDEVHKTHSINEINDKRIIVCLNNPDSKPSAAYFANGALLINALDRDTVNSIKKGAPMIISKETGWAKDRDLVEILDFINTVEKDLTSRVGVE